MEKGHVRKMLAMVLPLAAMIAAVAPGMAFADTPGATFEVDGATYAFLEDEGEVSFGSGQVGERAISQSWSGPLVIPETVTHAGRRYTVTAIAQYACTTCTSLTEVTIPASVRSIGFKSFAYCGTMDDSGDTPVFSGLTKVNIAEGSQMNIIGDNAFTSDYALEAFVIPPLVESIGTRAFQDCFSFEYLKCAPNSVLRGVGVRAFGATLPVMDSSTIGVYQRGPGYITKPDSDPEVYIPEGDKVYSHLKSVELPSTVENIGDGAFENNRVLTKLEWGEGCQTKIIGDYAFQFCTNLEEGSVPAVTWAPEGLGPYSFQYCVNMKTFTYKGKVRAPYSGYSERGIFRGDSKLETVIYLADKYHLPHGTLTTIDTGRLAFTHCDPTVYYKVDFYASGLAYEEGEQPVGSAILREGIPWCQITSGLPEKDADGKTNIYQGAVPALGEGMGWACSTGGGASPLSNAVAAWPVESKNLDGGGISLSSNDFMYTSDVCKPDVVVKDSVGNAIADGAYSLVWERKNSNGEWVSTTDFVTAGKLRVYAVAASGSAYVGQTQPAEYGISILEEGDTFVVDGVTYEVWTEVGAGTPEAVVGDARNLAVDADRTGEVVIPGVIYPEGSKVGYNVIHIAAAAFGNNDPEKACTGITSIVIGEGVKEIKGAAFKNMTGLEKVSLPASMKIVGANAFANDSSLETVEFVGDSIATIGMRAFSNCQSLESVSLPAIESVFAMNCFENCLSLTDVEFRGSLSSGAINQFAGCEFIERVVFRGNNPGIEFPESADMYAMVTFEDGNHNTIGTADIALGTKAESLASGLSQSAILAGAVPALPSGKTFWAFSDGSTTLSQAAVAVASANAAPPAEKPAAKPVTGTFAAGSKSSKALYTITSSSKRTVTYKTCKYNGKSAVVPATVTIKGVKYTVTKVGSKAFAKVTKVKTVTVKSKAITSFSKAFKSSKVKTVKVPSSKKKKYAKLLKKKYCGKAVTVK